MKIICIEGNYKGGLSDSSFPLFSVKPESCLLRNNRPFFLPDHAPEISPKAHIVLKISRLGKNIQEKFAHLYFNEIGIGLDMIPNSILMECRKNGLPWDTAKCFDFSSPLGNFMVKENIPDINHITFALSVNGKKIISSNSSEMIHPFGKIIEHVSKYVMLKMGDLIYTGSPDYDFLVAINDSVEASISEKRMLWLNIK
jgi:acylpyruvate hydrolase